MIADSSALAVHGLATEDVLVGEHEGVMALAGAAALPVAGAVLALSALPTLRDPRTVRWLLWLNGAILIAIGGLLHDIGKLSVPDEILKKPGPLDDGEYAVIRRHPLSGEQLIGELGGFSAQVRRLVADHRERLGGGGYPRGIAGEQIDLPTRVLTACDVYDSLVSNRVYRDAWTRERAFALLDGESGAAFDPRCVAALERVIEREDAAAQLAGWRPMPDPVARPAPVLRSQPLG